MPEKNWVQFDDCHELFLHYVLPSKMDKSRSLPRYLWKNQYFELNGKYNCEIFSIDVENQITVITGTWDFTI
jgi:hypothetical protein